MKIPAWFPKSRTPPKTTTDEPDESRPFTASIDYLINWLLALTRRAGLIRMVLAIVVMFLTAFLLLIFNQPLDEWRLGIIALFNPGFVPSIQYPLNHLVSLTLRSIISWGMLGHMIAFGLPFYLALQFAGIFLDDIFELKDIEIARRFITRAAFTYPTTGVIHIENGDVRPTDRRSTIVKIGGPGQVRVSLENVAVFEKIDGTPDMVGPTAGNRWFTHALDGFENLRQVIDVRDLTVPISDLFARTKDGIPITVANIRLLFSVQRDSQYSTLSRPYPFSQAAILELVYNQAKGHWTNSIIGLVRSTLVRFISENTLAEIFSTVGDPEIQSQIKRQRTIQEHVDLTKQTEEREAASQPANSAQPVSEGDSQTTNAYATVNQIGANKVPRLQISRRFYEGFTRGFPKLASQRGVRLEWIDIGTWHPAPTAKSVLEQHEEAFRITAQNMILSDSAVLAELNRQEQAGELLRLIRQPIYRFYQLEREGTERDEMVASLLEEYLGALRAARDDFYKQDIPIPDSMQRGMDHISRYQRELLKRNGGTFVGK